MNINIYAINTSRQNILCLCFIDNPIEYNYFTRDLSNFDSKTVLCSFYQVETIFNDENVDIFNYIHGIVLNEIVQIATLHKVNEDYFLHDDTRNCLFDMCGLKKDIVLMLLSGKKNTIAFPFSQSHSPLSAFNLSANSKI